MRAHSIPATLLLPAAVSIAVGVQLEAADVGVFEGACWDGWNGEELTGDGDGDCDTPPRCSLPLDASPMQSK